MEKMLVALGVLGSKMQLEIEEKQEKIIEELVRSGPKISRGEKYLGLPYIILDYPRIFEKENILAIRTLFWWGNFCSVTLHVNGKYLPYTAKHLTRRFKEFQQYDFYISTSGNEWNHDLRTMDYHLLSAATCEQTNEALQTNQFLKLAAKVELTQWNNMENRLYSVFLNLIKLVEI